MFFREIRRSEDLQFLLGTSNYSPLKKSASIFCVYIDISDEIKPKAFFFSTETNKADCETTFCKDEFSESGRKLKLPILLHLLELGRRCQVYLMEYKNVCIVI